MSEEIKEILSNMLHIILKYSDDFDELEENEIRYQLPYKQMEKLYDHIISLQQKVEQLEKENRQLCDVRYSLDRVQLEKRIEQSEERSTYLERSNNRREDEIIELRDENVDLASKNKQLEKELNTTNNLLHKANDEVVSYCNRCIELENIRKEVVEYIKQHQVIISIADEPEIGFCDEFDIFSSPKNLLNILNKGSDK